MVIVFTQPQGKVLNKYLILVLANDSILSGINAIVAGINNIISIMQITR